MRSGRKQNRTQFFVAVAVAIGLAGAAWAAPKKVAYPEVKVELAERFSPDAAFDAMHARFAAAVAKKDQQALFALVGPTFVWTLDGALTDEFDLGRDALHNFKVVFGFRAVGADTDGGVDKGPFWDALKAFVDDTAYYKSNASGKSVCGPLLAYVIDSDVRDKAIGRIAAVDEGVEWYFTLGDTPVLKAPGDRGPPIAKVGTVALPLVSTFPVAKPGEAPPVPSFLEVLLPSGKTGWIAAAAAKPLAAERLCYAKTVAGEWKIVAYDQPE
jgi:hypothetical protein